MIIALSALVLALSNNAEMGQNEKNLGTALKMI
jgi:hypothetical protein